MPRAAVHKERLVETAMRLFRRQGYASTGLQQILAESGAPKGSLYHYFPSGKEGIGEAAVALAGRRVAEMLGGLAERHADPAAFLAAYADTMAGWMEESGFRSGCPLATTLLETAPQSPAITATARAALDGWAEIVAGVFARAGLAGDEARRRGRLVIAAMEGALLLARVEGSTAPIHEVAALART